MPEPESIPTPSETLAVDAYTETVGEQAAGKVAEQVTVSHDNGEVRLIPIELLADFESRGFTRQ